MRHYFELKDEALRFLFLLWSLWFLDVSGRSILSPLLPLIEDEFTLTHARATSIFTFQSIGHAFATIISGLYAGRVGFKRTIVFSFAVLACVCFFILFTKVLSTFYLIVFVAGSCAGIYIPSIMPLIREHFAEKDWGKTVSIHDSAAPISIFTVPFLVLFLLYYFHWRNIFGLVGIALVIIAVLLSFMGDELKIAQPHKRVFKNLITRSHYG